METTHRLKMKIGPHEFEAEGKPELVKKQFEEWKALIGESRPASLVEVLSSLPKAKPPASGESWGSTEMPASVLDRVFRKGDPLSLLATPKSENSDVDALLVLIYGLTELRGEPAVTGTALKKSASKSGVNVNRISPTLRARADLIQAAGTKKGKRYSLNNRGIAEAKRIINAMVE